MEAGRVLEEILSRRDPHGYYVIPIAPEGLEALRRRLPEGAVIVEAGDVVLVKVRSRSAAARLARAAASLGVLVLDEV